MHVEMIIRDKNKVTLLFKSSEKGVGGEGWHYKKQDGNKKKGRVTS